MPLIQNYVGFETKSKPEDCTLSIQNLSDPVLVTSEMSDDVGAILVDPATETDEIYILPKGNGIE